MLRTFILTTALTVLSAPAFAGHPDDTAPDTAKHEKTIVNKTLKSAAPLSATQLPSAAEIDDIMADMPDLNALMGGMMEMMSDPEMQSTMKRAGRSLEQKLESSGAMDPQAGGMPDMNAAMGAMLSMMSDEEVMGDMLKMLGGMAEVMEEHVQEAEKSGN